jgi:peroxiredoxin
MVHAVKKFVSAVGVLLLVGVAPPVSAQDTGLPIGSRAPAVKLDNTAGDHVSLANVIGKKPVLLEFWATWCENCRALEPHMLAAYKKYGADVAFYGIAIPINQSLARVQKYVQEHKYPFPMLWDKDGAIAGDYDAAATSFVVVIDKSGKVVYTGVGGDQDLDAAIRKAR